jgi:hypothetical protein
MKPEHDRAESQKGARGLECCKGELQVRKGQQGSCASQFLDEK